MGRVPSHIAPWMRDSGDELALSKGCTFDEAAGSRVVEFLESFCCLSEGQWAGKLLKLAPFQLDLVMRLYGWKRPNGTRRYRTVYLEVGKKNGKSPFTSSLAIYHVVADGEGGPKVFLNATDRDQVKNVFDPAANMVRQSPDLAEVLDIHESTNRIVCRSNFGSIVANSNVVDSKDGKNASFIVNDELHLWRGRKMWAVFRYAGASRAQPINFSITTAGEAEAGVWYEQRTYSEDVVSGKVPDWTHLGLVYRADPKDPLDSPATWAKANPALGTILDPDEMAADYERAKRIPAELADFRRYRCNVVTASTERYLPPDAWKACGEVERTDLYALARRPCWVGLDLSSVNDLTAMAVIFGDEESGFDAFFWFWLPEANIVELENRHCQPYRVWAEAGWITLTPGAAVDYAFIRREVNDLAELGDIKGICLDPFNATNLYTQLKEEDGLPVQMLRQGDISLNAPTKDLLRDVLEGKLRHGNHPIANWNAGNAVATRNANENARLCKEKSRGKIDGLAALVNARAAHNLPDTTTPKTSVYESRKPRCLG
jgi:phage terminase large subunit-like protein